MKLILYTPMYERYKINPKTGAISKDGVLESDQWIFKGLRHVKRTNDFIPLKALTPETLKSIQFVYKNGNPQWTVQDNDHGTTRVWGNTPKHGVKGMYFETE